MGIVPTVYVIKVNNKEIPMAKITKVKKKPMEPMTREQWKAHNEAKRLRNEYEKGLSKGWGIAMDAAFDYLYKKTEVDSVEYETGLKIIAEMRNAFMQEKYK